VRQQEFLPPFAVALLILPFIIQYGKLVPWHPSTIDLQVYVYAVKDMLAGKDIFATTTPFWNLYFIYPPIAAILMTPLAFGPYLFWQVVWTGGLVWAQQSVLKRCGAPRGWKLGLLGIAVLVAMEPIRTTLGYGQVNTVLMALVIADLLPDAPGERRRIPQGTLIGLAGGDQADAGTLRDLRLLDRQDSGRDHCHDQLCRLHWHRRDLALPRNTGFLRRSVWR
jgi:alpha-1,2-mannosyltransferase